MMVQMIRGCTRILGKAQGYLGLPIRDEIVDEINMMSSIWEPTPAELVKLVAGAPVKIIVMGSAHPPIKVEVGDE
jgi:hypothetical protein